jgi:hypothetical protein
LVGENGAVATVSEVTAMPEVVVPNGMTAPDKGRSLVLIADGKPWSDLEAQHQRLENTR